MIRTLILVISLGLHPHLLLAANELSTVEPPVPAAKNQQEDSRATSINNISAIMVGCDLDRKCMQTLLEEIAENNADPLYQNVLLVLASQQEQIDFEAAACQLEETRVLRKEAAYCISQIIHQLDHAANDAAKTELNSCIQNKMETWARKGNLFAQGLLANRASKLGDSNAKGYWERLMQNQAGTPAYETYVKCSRSFQLIPPGISEVAFQTLKKKS